MMAAAGSGLLSLLFGAYLLGTVGLAGAPGTIT